MKKQFLFLSMLLMGLFVAVSTARAEMTPEEAETKGHWARLTARPATTTNGTGTVSVNVNVVDEADAVFAEVSSKDTYTEHFAMTSVSTEAHFNSVYAKSADGSYFSGWSFTDGGTDLNMQSIAESGLFLAPSMEKGHANVRVYDLYAAFNLIRFQTNPVIDGIGGEYQTITVVAEADLDKGTGLSLADDVRHFKKPVITKKDGTLGEWEVDVTEWEAGSNISLFGATAELTIGVTFTAPDDEPREYAATLTLETKAGVKLNIPLYARTPEEETGQAIRYNKAKEKQEQGAVADLLDHAEEDDIIKLIGDYNTAATTNKNITLDFNGYSWKQPLTVDGGTLTIAYSPYGGKISNSRKVTVNAGKLVANGATLSGYLEIKSGAEAVINGAVVNKLVTNNGTLTVTDGALEAGVTSAGTLTVNGGAIRNESGTAVIVTGGTANITRGTIVGSDYGVEVMGGAATIEKLAAISGDIKALNGAGGTLTVNNGKFADPNVLADGTITFKAGFFKTNDGEAAHVYGKPIWNNTAGAEFREGYKLFAGAQDEAQTSGVSVCRINNNSYATLEAALDYANNNPSKPAVIFMVNDYTLKAGYYTIPANATLVVPMSDEQDAPNTTVEHKSVGSGENYTTPYPFRTLTFASGVNMNILGALEVTCVEACKTGNPMQSVPDGPYGHLVLQAGSHITLSAGSELRAWGYITGEGEIDARRGSIVREQFQIGDWKGGDISYTMIMDEDPQRKLHLFPVYEYFIQNIESPIKYHPGSALLCAVAVEVSGIRAYADEIKVVGVQGEAAMFLMNQMADAENTWVRKRYDASKDQQVYEVNSGAQLGSMVIDLGEIPWSIIQPSKPGTMNIKMDSRDFVLPLTSNFKIHLLSGQMEFTQSTACLPGMEVEIDKESTISIVQNENPDVVDGALYFYDADQWGRYVRGNTFGSIVNYSATVGGKPTVRDISSAAAIGDAKLIVHGTFQMAEGCAVYTTAGTKEKSHDGNTYVYEADLTSGGASIISSNEDAGTFIFLSDAMPSNELTTTKDGTKLTGITFTGGKLNQDALIHYDQSSDAWAINTALGSTANIFNFHLCTSARLKNTDGSFVNTFTDAEHYALEGDAYCFIDDRWRILRVDEDNECFLADVADPLNPQYYAKPQEYVAITATKDGEGNFIGNADHTFSDAAGAGRLFILLGGNDCQWWEVENRDNLYHCIHPQNDTYYYWDDVDGEWKEKRFIITWKNWDGTIIQTADEHGNPTDSYSVTYGTMAEFFGANPTREPSIDYTYDFAGWSPDLAPVTKDVIYTATYIPKERKYTIIFQQEGGMEIERQLLGHNEVPVCENVPVRTGFTLQWTPAIAAVTGDAVYTATWLEEPPTEYEITFVDYDGDLENHTIWKGNVAVGTLPAAPAISDGKPVGAAGKPATNEFSYVFDHWSPNVVLVTQAMTYTAVYREVPVKYTIIFQNEDGSEIERGEYKYGEMPACTATPTKPSTDEWSYTLMWKPEIQTVMDGATYRADFETLKTKNKYTVAAKCSPANAAVVTGGGIYEYNPANNAVTIRIESIADGYTFLGWTDSGTEVERTMPVTGNIDLTAVFATNNPDWTITWKNESGSETLQEVGQMNNTPTTYTGPTPTKPSSGSTNYIFDGWTTEPFGAGTYYKNGLTPKAEGNATYYAHFDEDATSNDLHVEGTTVLDNPVDYQDLYITSNGVNVSGQLVNAHHLTLHGDAYFDLNINAQHHTWYAVAVPWQVRIGEGISVNGHTLAAKSEIDVTVYDGDRRAQNGASDRGANWNFMNDGDIMHPGVLYMIALSNNAETIRFKKVEGTSIEYGSTAVMPHVAPAGHETDRGWNGIANPALFHAYVNPFVNPADPQKGQVYNPATMGYDVIDFEQDGRFVLGRAAFVQVDDAKDIHVWYNKPYDYDPSLAPAPRRMKAIDSDFNAEYEVRLSPMNKAYTDRVFVSMNNSKEQDAYTIGKDLSKMGVSTKVPQMWVNRYDAQLCVNTMTPVEGSADYPLSIFAPKNGEYTLSIKYGAVADTESDLYLTLDGKAIWNLSRNAYVLDLEQGTTERYGLRLSAKAPQSPQAIDEILVDSKDETAVKVLFNGQVFIIRGGEVYTITGNKVK